MADERANHSSLPRLFYLSTTIFFLPLSELSFFLRLIFVLAPVEEVIISVIEVIKGFFAEVFEVLEVLSLRLKLLLFVVFVLDLEIWRRGLSSYLSVALSSDAAAKLLSVSAVGFLYWDILRLVSSP